KIGYLGRLSFEKNLEILIEVSKELTKKKYLHDLIIAGDDKDIRFRKYIEKLKQKSTNHPHISFIGRVKEEDKNLFYQNINLFVLPSNNPLEAFGIVQLESMINNVPVIAYNMPGVRTIILNVGSGALFSNKKELFDQIITFYLKKNKEIKIAENVKNFYSKKKFNLGMKKIFF
ncbi:glycosyltransferase, partial [Alphaproteobacteria bacterium]|nr:glycosyltransferase [Alphaproteobacteria bacterium]